MATTIEEMSKKLDAILQYIRTIEQHMMVLEARPTTIHAPSCPRPVIKLSLNTDDYEIDD